MNLHNETPLLAGNGASVFSKGVAPSEYRFPTFNANNFAATLFATRYRVSPTRARLLVELAGYARKA